MTARTARDAELLSLKTRIARTRRRLDRDVDRWFDAVLLKRDWRAYVEKHPARSLTAAAGIGALLASLAPAGGAASGRRFAAAAIGAAWPQIWRELAQQLMLRGGDVDEAPTSGDPS